METEENSSVENWKHFRYDGYFCKDGNDKKNRVLHFHYMKVGS